MGDDAALYDLSYGGGTTGGGLLGGLFSGIGFRVFIHRRRRNLASGALLPYLYGRGPC
jgi:hypothetical protein